LKHSSAWLQSNAAVYKLLLFDAWSASIKHLSAFCKNIPSATCLKQAAARSQSFIASWKLLPSDVCPAVLAHLFAFCKKTYLPLQVESSLPHLYSTLPLFNV
jgi:hypothetical protein